MKLYDILKNFSGSQNGIDGPFDFVAGEQKPLSDDLGNIAVSQGWAKLAESKPEKRETKVEAPAETKVEAPEELKAEVVDEADKKPAKKKK